MPVDSGSMISLALLCCSGYGHERREPKASARAHAASLPEGSINP
jgi:hypothetical protein